MSKLQTLTEFRPDGARNFIRQGDIVKAKIPGKRACLGRLTEIAVDPEGQPQFTVTLWARLNGDAHGHRGHWRILAADQIERVSQTRWSHLRQDAR